MIIYVPRLIESAEQAEALPLWTMATIEHHPQDALPQIAMRIVRGWRNRDLIDGRIPHADMIGWTALVPIEAEEEWEDEGRPVWSLGEGEVTPADVDDYERRNGRRPVRRLVTPWEEA